MVWFTLSSTVYVPYCMAQLDSDVRIDGMFLDLLDTEWRKDKLPDEDIYVPIEELPEIEPDNGDTTESIKEQEKKWNDVDLQEFLKTLNQTKQNQ